MKCRIKNIFQMIVLAVVIFSAVQASAGSKKGLFIDRIQVGGDISESQGREIESFIARSMIARGDYIILSRSTLEDGLSSENREKLSRLKENGDIRREIIMRSVVVETIVYGSFIRKNESIYLTLYKIERDSGRTALSGKKTVRFANRHNAEEAVEVVCKYLNSGLERPVQEFQDRMNIEDKLQEKRERIGKAARSDAEREDEFRALSQQRKNDIRKSIGSSYTFLRLGVSLRGSRYKYDDFNDFFERGPLFMIDLISPDFLSVFDLYGRYSYITFKARDVNDTPSSETINDLWQSGDYSYHFFDAGLRVRAGFWFNMTRLDFYLLGAGRYESNGGIGYYGGAGFELVLWKHAGFFGEYNYGVLEPVDNGIDIGYSRFIFGMTFRL